MSYIIDPELEYFLGISLPEKETELLSSIRKKIEKRIILSSPPHITIKPPFQYHFEKPLVEQLEKWAKRQRAFKIKLERLSTFKHRDYVSIVVTPEQSRPLKKLEQQLSQSIKFLPEQTNFTPHLTIANRVPYERVDEVKKFIRNLKLSMELNVDNITLFEHLRMKPWNVKEVFEFGATTASGVKTTI